MGTKQSKKEPLRRRAEKLLSKKSQIASKIEDKDVKKLVHELQVHQIELEMQNEELRRAQEEIEESRLKYSDLYDFAPVGYFTFSPAGEIVEVNLTGANLLGIEREKLLHRSFLTFVDLEFQSLFRDHRLNVLTSGERERCELKLIKADGKSFYVFLRSISVRDGKRFRIRSAVGDTTELRKAQAKAENEHAFRIAIENSILSGIAAVDLGGRQSYVNIGFCRMVGRSEEELLGEKPPFAYWPPEELDQINRIFQTAMNGKAPREGLQLRLMRKNGERFDALVVSSLLKDHGGNVIGWIGTFGDITHLKQVEEELRQLNARLEERILQRTAELEIANEQLRREISDRQRADEALREAKQEADRRAAEAEEGKRILDALMKHVPTGITIADAKNLRVEVMSLYAQILTGFLHNRMLEVPLDAHAPYWLHPENSTPAKPEEMPLFRAIRQGEIVIDEEWILHRPDGERFTILCNAGPIRDPKGNINAGVLAWTDISTQKMAQEKIEMQAKELRQKRDELVDRTFRVERLNRELVALNAELDDFTHVASHDLQEPLRTLTAFSDLLRKDLGQSLPERVAQDLGFITDAAKRMQTLIHDLLALSRAGRIAKKREKVSLSECADQALGALTGRVKETGAKISRDKLPEVWGDSTLLRQVYQNLIGNALKFSGDQGPIIQLTFEEREGEQIFGVKDNGIGIEPKYAPQIFQPFRRLHGRAEYEGSGIGLAICRKAVERHGGKIWVESELGKGAHFRFTISQRGREQ